MKPSQKEKEERGKGEGRRKCVGTNTNTPISRCPPPSYVFARFGFKVLPLLFLLTWI